MTDLNDDQRAIAEECDAVKAMLLDKNRDYGNSALDPVRVFSKTDAVEQILVRLDDKLSRLKRGSEAGEDVILDILGYLVLLRIAQKRQLSVGPAPKIHTIHIPTVDDEALCGAERPTLCDDPDTVTCIKCKRAAARWRLDQPLHFSERYDKPALCGSFGDDHTTNDPERVTCEACKKKLPTYTINAVIQADQSASSAHLSTQALHAHETMKMVREKLKKINYNPTGPEQFDRIFALVQFLRERVT